MQLNWPFSIFLSSICKAYTKARASQRSLKNTAGIEILHIVAWIELRQYQRPRALKQSLAKTYMLSISRPPCQVSMFSINLHVKLV